MITFLELARKRFSARKYLNKPVEEEKLLKVLEAGRIAPSAKNLQPWFFIVIRDEDNRKRMKEVYDREWFYTAPVIIVMCGDHSQSWIRPDGKDFCDVDVAIATDHMTLAAADLGLGTCWVCYFDRQKCSVLMDLPGHIEPIALLPLGYPEERADIDRHRSRRKPLEKIVLHETFTG